MSMIKSTALDKYLAISAVWGKLGPCLAKEMAWVEMKEAQKAWSVLN